MAGDSDVRPHNMNKVINYFWNPDQKTVQGFKYGTYIILAPVLLLNFILPWPVVIGALFIFFILKSIVSMRAAATHDIDKEKLEKYTGENSVAKRAYVIFCMAIGIFIVGIIVFYINTGGVLGLLAAIFIAVITLPGFFEEIVIIKRCKIEENLKV